MNRWLWVVMWGFYWAWPLALPTVTMAQISLDGSLGPAANLSGPDYVISADMGRTEGQNLFHSFGSFNVPTGGSATFQGPSQVVPIQNIVGRVTGGEPSQIDGVLRSEIPGANLFLLNPSGIVFGVNASLDVSGSFYMSTADTLRFEDGAVFRVDPDGESVLSMRAPEAFGFLQAPQGNVTIRSRELAVPGSRTLGVTGGEVTIEGGQLEARSGVISLTSVASAGEVPLSAVGMTPPEGVALGNVAITNRATLDTDGVGGGVVAIRGGQLTVAQSRITANNSGNMDRIAASIDIDVTNTASIRDGAELRADSIAAGRGGDLNLAADTLNIADSTILTQSRTEGTGGNVNIRAARVELADNTFVGTQALNNGLGGELRVAAGQLNLTRTAVIATEARNNAQGGDVLITADRVALSNNARIISLTSSRNDAGAGNLVIQAKAFLQISGAEGDETGIFAQGGIATEIGEIQIDSGALLMDGGVIGTPAEAGSIAGARAGNISVSAETLDLKGGAIIDSSTLGGATGGDITIRATDMALSERASIVSGTSGAGDAGAITIGATRLTLTDDALIASSSSGGIGFGGNITIAATAVDLSGDATIEAGTRGAGHAGRIEIDVVGLTLSDGAEITSDSVRGPGLGGNVEITAQEDIVVVGENTSIRSNTVGSGRGGSIELKARTVRLDEGAVMTVGSTGAGDSGSVRIEAQKLLLRGGSTITTEATRASGGDITIQVERLELRASQMTAAVQGEVGTFGGDITINAESALILQGSTISASAVEGNGGNIDIETGVLLQDFESTITATATVGIDGVVGIRAATTNISGTVTPLPQRFASTEPLSQLRCAQRLRGGQISSFVVAGRAGLPVDPSGGLPSLLVDLPQEADGVLAQLDFDQPTAVSTAAHWYPCSKDQPRAAHRLPN